MTTRRRLLSAALCVIPACGAVAGEAPDMKVVRDYREAHAAEILLDYSELLSIPNTPAHPGGLVQTAEWIRVRPRR